MTKKQIDWVSASVVEKKIAGRRFPRHRLARCLHHREGLRDTTVPILRTRLLGLGKMRPIRPGNMGVAANQYIHARKRLQVSTKLYPLIISILSYQSQPPLLMINYDELIIIESKRLFNIKMNKISNYKSQL